MPDEQLTVKQQAFAQAMYTPGSDTFGNGTESARKAQYKGDTGTLQSVAAENVLKPVVIAEKQRIQAKTAKKVNIDRDYCIARLQKIAEGGGTTDRNVLTALSLIGDFTGDKRERAPNTEREAQILALMDDEEREYRKAWTKQRTDAETRPRLARGAG